MHAKPRLVDRFLSHSALLGACALVAMGLVSCGGATTAKSTTGTGLSSSPGTGSMGTSGTSGTSGTTGSGGTSGSGGGSGGSGGSGSGSGGTGGTGGTGGSGGASTPVVIQSFTKPERIAGNGETDMIVDAKGNLDIANAHRGGLDPLFTTNFLRLSPGPTEVTANTTLPPLANDPQVAADSSGNVYLTWLPAPSTSTNPAFVNGVFSRSDDGGATFTLPVPVFSSGTFPHMALDSSNDIFVSFATPLDAATSPSEVFASRSTDGGKTFALGPPLSDPSRKATAPYIAVNSKGHVDVIWQYNGSGQECDSSSNFQSCSPCDIFFSQSTDGGANFSTPVNVSNSSGCAGLDGSYQNDQQMQIDSSGNVNIVWDDSVAGVMFRRSTDGGSTFSAPTTVTPSQGIFPKIAVDASGNIDVIWAPADASAAVVFSRSADGGAKFSPPIPMGAGETGSNPQLATDGSGDIDVLWAESHAIRFSQSFDGGKTFSSPVSVSTDTTDFSDVSPDIFPFTQVHMVVEANGTVDLAFGTDQFAGNDQIYLWFSRGATSSKAPPPPLSFYTLCCSAGTVGKAYSGNAFPSGGTPPYTVTASNLPPGLFLQGGPPFWQILGTPTTAGTFAATVTLKDSAGLSLTNTLSVTIAASSGSSATSISRSSR